MDLGENSDALSWTVVFRLLSGSKQQYKFKVMTLIRLIHSSVKQCVRNLL